MCMIERPHAGKILILCGKSGSGKDAIQRELKKSGFKPIVSVTTRPMREGETDGVEYNFVSRKTFSDLVEWGEMIEYRSYNTKVNGEPDVWFYGAQKMTLDKSEDYVVILDLEGAKSFVEYFGKESCCVCYINVPDDVRRQRCEHRGSFDKTEFVRRMAADAADFQDSAVEAVATNLIDNSKSLGECVKSVASAYTKFVKRAS